MTMKDIDTAELREPDGFPAAGLEVVLARRVE
jgi:hypothetical protein